MLVQLGNLHHSEKSNILSQQKRKIENDFSKMFFSINFRFFDIPMSVLPDVRSSSEIYGKLVSVGSFLPVVLCVLSKSIIIRTHKTREFKIKHELKKKKEDGSQL